MVSAWWLLVAFVGGGWAGILVMALAYMASNHPDREDSLNAHVAG
jgi:hypothetical protein